MAQTITEKNVIQITVQDTDSNKQSFNLENPKSGLTIAQVREVFEPLIATGKWYSRQGNPINYIEQATLTKTKKITLDDGTGAVTVTPSSGSTSGGGIKTVTFTVDGSPIKGYNYIRKGTSVTNVTALPAEIDTENNTITAKFNVNGQFGDVYDLEIVTIASKLTVTITVNG